MKGATLYTTFSPCLICAKMIINAGITEVKYLAAYSATEISHKMLAEAGVELTPVWITKGGLCDFISIMLKGSN